MGIFSRTRRKSQSSSQSVLKKIMETPTCKLQVWGSIMFLHVLWVRSAEAVTNRRHNALLSSGLSRYVLSLIIAERKRCVCLSWGGKGFCGWVSFWCQEAHHFRHALILLPVRGPQGNCYFCIYFFHVIVFSIHYLIPTFLFNTNNLHRDIFDRKYIQK